MRIQCLITRSFLTRYLDEELGERVRRAIDAHVEKCAGCRALLSRAVDERERLRGFEAPEISEREWDELWTVVVRRVGSEETESSPTVDIAPFRSRPGRARYFVLAAAVALLVAGAAFRVLLSSNQPQQTPISSYIQYHEEAVDGHVLLENYFWNAQVLPVSYAASR